VLTIYATALAVGGTLLFGSVVLGHHGVDHGHDFGQGGGGHGGHGGHAGGPELGLIAAFLSVRFWTFALAFFGLTGVIFEKIVPMEDGRIVLASSVVAGFVIGLAAALIVNKLRAETVTSTPSELGYVGLEGEVLLEVTPAEAGRIRVSARGSLIDLPAKTDGPSFPKGARALVVDVTDGVARVTAPAPKG